MSKQFWAFLVIGLAVVAVGVFFTLAGTKGAHLTLDGKILKVRTLSTGDKDSILVVDFRVTNQSDVQFVVDHGLIKITKADGTEAEGSTIARSDMNRVFDYYKLLGPKFNEVLIIRDRINGKNRIDRMLAASFPLSQAELDARKNLTLTLVDVDGPTFTFSEH